MAMISAIAIIALTLTLAPLPPLWGQLTSCCVSFFSFIFFGMFGDAFLVHPLGIGCGGGGVDVSSFSFALPVCSKVANTCKKEYFTISRI